MALDQEMVAGVLGTLPVVDVSPLSLGSLTDLKTQLLTRGVVNLS